MAVTSDPPEGTSSPPPDTVDAAVAELIVSLRCLPPTGPITESIRRCRAGAVARIPLTDGSRIYAGRALCRSPLDERYCGPRRIRSWLRGLWRVWRELESLWWCRVRVHTFAEEVVRPRLLDALRTRANDRDAHLLTVRVRDDDGDEWLWFVSDRDLSSRQHHHLPESRFHLLPPRSMLTLVHGLVLVAGRTVQKPSAGRDNDWVKALEEGDQDPDGPPSVRLGTPRKGERYNDTVSRTRDLLEDQGRVAHMEYDHRRDARLELAEPVDIDELRGTWHDADDPEVGW